MSGETIVEQVRVVDFWIGPARPNRRGARWCVSFRTPLMIKRAVYYFRTEADAVDFADAIGCGSCRVCGCTDDDCSGCVERTGASCSWVEPDLCSACVES